MGSVVCTSVSVHSRLHHIVCVRFCRHAQGLTRSQNTFYYPFHCVDSSEPLGAASENTAECIAALYSVGGTVCTLVYTGFIRLDEYQPTLVCTCGVQTVHYM